jgi:hypothetical protein
MFSKNVSVACPYCGAGFSIPVGANYTKAEAFQGWTVRIQPG